MAIDPTTESLLSLTEAAKSLPPRRGGKRPHVSCLYRWTKTGCKGVILESLQCGGTRVTSQEALARFFERLTYADSPQPVRSPAQRRRAVEAAERELEQQGL